MLWTFFAFALPITLGVVVCTVLHYASPKVMHHVKVVVAYAWFVNVSIVILTPVDVWTAICLGNGQPASECGSTLPIGVMWSFAYWSAYFLTWAIIPIMQGYEDSGDFTVRERLRTSIRGNLILIGVVGSVAVTGVIILLATKRMAWDTIVKLAIGASNAFALVTGALLLGFGLVEIPRGLWRHADLAERQRWLSHRVAKTAQKLDQAHQELSTAIVITQATSLQMPRKDPLRPMMDIIEGMAVEDASFKPSGGQIGENDMDYDTDLRSMAALRRRLRNAQDNYSRYKTEYCAVVWDAMELEDTLYNYSCPNGRMFVSSLRPPRTGRVAPVLDLAEWWWRCVLWGALAKGISVLLGGMSVAILFAEATLLWRNPHTVVDLSLFSQLVTAVGMQAELVQLFVFVPLVYLCVCTYFSLFKLGMFSFYYLLPHHTNSISLLINCSMVSRYAAPMCYNFLRLIHMSHYDKRSRKLIPLHTVFEKSMKGLPDYFERIYPLCIILAALLIATNVHQRIAKALGTAWRRFRFETDDEPWDEAAPLGSATNLLAVAAPGSPVHCSPAGLAILKKERLHLNQGMSLAEHVLPLARNFTAMELGTGVLEGTPAGGASNAAIPGVNGGKTLSPRVNGLRSNYLGDGLTRRGSPSLHPQVALEEGALEDPDQDRGAVPARQVMASLYETLLKAASGFREPGPPPEEGGQLLGQAGEGSGSQGGSPPGSPEGGGRSHAWREPSSNSESNLLGSSGKHQGSPGLGPGSGGSAGAGGWGAGQGGLGDGGGGNIQRSLFPGSADKGSRTLLPLRASSPLDTGLQDEEPAARELTPSLATRGRGIGSPRSPGGLGGDGGGGGLDRADSRGWGGAVKLRWQDFAQNYFRGGKLEDVFRSGSHSGGGSREAEELILGPSSSSLSNQDPRSQPPLEHVFTSLNNLRQWHREGYGSDEDEVRRPGLDRNGQTRPFF